MYTSDGENIVRKGYVANHIPDVLLLYGAGTVLWGEDPGNIIDDIMNDDDITKLTR